MPNASDAHRKKVLLHSGRLSRAAAALLRADAFVVGRHVFLSKSAVFEIDNGTPAGDDLLAHELVHIEQYRRSGVVRFLARYFTDYLSARARGLPHRAAYLAIPFEREAREKGPSTSPLPDDLPRGA
jgi:Domain of unknown function (DUF4157)